MTYDDSVQNILDSLTVAVSTLEDDKRTRVQTVIDFLDVVIATPDDLPVDPLGKSEVIGALRSGAPAAEVVFWLKDLRTSLTPLPFDIGTQYGNLGDLYHEDVEMVVHHVINPLIGWIRLYESRGTAAEGEIAALPHLWDAVNTAEVLRHQTMTPAMTVRMTLLIATRDVQRNARYGEDYTTPALIAMEKIVAALRLTQQ